MRLNILFITFAISSTVFGLPSSPSPPSGGSQEPSENNGGKPRKQNNAAHAAKLLASYIGLRIGVHMTRNHAAVQGLRNWWDNRLDQTAEFLTRRIHGPEAPEIREMRRLREEQIQRYRQQGRTLNPDDTLVMFGPDGKLHLLTSQELRDYEDCETLMKNRKASRLEIFAECLKYALDPSVGIDQLDYGPGAEYSQQQQGQKKAKADSSSSTDDNHNRDDDGNTHLSKVVVDKANTLGQTLKDNVVKVSGAIASTASEEGKNKQMMGGGVMASPGAAGRIASPPSRMPVPPL